MTLTYQRPDIIGNQLIKVPVDLSAYVNGTNIVKNSAGEISLNLAEANTWTGTTTFNGNTSFGVNGTVTFNNGFTLSGASGSETVQMTDDGKEVQFSEPIRFINTADNPNYSALRFFYGDGSSGSGGSITYYTNQLTLTGAMDPAADTSVEILLWPNYNINSSAQFITSATSFDAYFYNNNESATSTTNYNSPTIHMVGSLYNSSGAPYENDFNFQLVQTTTTSGYVNFQLSGINSTPTNMGQWNINGSLLLPNGVYSTAINNDLLQVQDAVTNDTTTASTLASLSLTPEYSGNIEITAIIRGSNDTIGDGIKLSLLNGSTTVDSETYTQEGLASNQHTFEFKYKLTGQTLGTALTIDLDIAAVTGGTASGKVVYFEAKEV